MQRTLKPRNSLWLELGNEGVQGYPVQFVDT